jgi:UDP-N-acetylmuramate--alanine ligase
VGGRPIYYDYAHHPTEISASLAAIRGVVKGKITLLFKPHTYSRTASLWQELCGALSLADQIIITDIYAAREEPIEGITAENLAIGVGNNAIYLPDGDAAQYILEKTEGAIVLMGAGDLTEIKRKLR